MYRIVESKHMKNLSNHKEVSEAFDRLFPLCRSILGQGYRDSLDIIKEYIPLQEENFPSGEKVLNWTVPKEWVIREAWIKDEYGNTVVNFKDSNLHVLHYSEAVDKYMDLEELKKYIYTSNSGENAIPYTFSYYKKRWGFCMSKVQLERMKPGKYHAYIDSEFIDGRLVVGHTKLQGESEKEILLSSYLCHPSMANNELSGPLVLAMLYQRIQKWEKRKFAYRFVINPETIGSISYLSRYGDELRKCLETGLVLTCLGGEESLRYKMSRQEVAPIDVLAREIREKNPDAFRMMWCCPFEGSDERQYCSPGFDFPIGQMSRKVYGSYKEYHTSLDTKELMGIDSIIESCDYIERFLLQYEQEAERLHKKSRELGANYIEKINCNCIDEVYQDVSSKIIDENRDEGVKIIDDAEKKPQGSYYRNLYPNGEVKLGDYDLYPTINSDGFKNDKAQELINQPWFIMCVMTILNFSDGKRSLEFCAKRLGRDVEELQKVAEILVHKGLLEKL